MRKLNCPHQKIELYNFGALFRDFSIDRIFRTFRFYIGAPAESIDKNCYFYRPLFRFFNIM